MHEDLRNGQPEAIEEMVKRELPLIYNLCLRLCRTAQDAEDLCQDVFVRAVRGLSTFRGDSAPSTWLYRIALNTWKNRLRSDQVRRTSQHVSFSSNADEDDSREIQIKETALTPEETAEHRDNRTLILKAMDLLEEDHKTILILRDMQHRSYDELVQVLGLSMGTVKSRLSRARLALREQFLKMQGVIHQ